MTTVQPGADARKSDAFAEIEAAWDAPLCCQTKQSPKPCRNQARWIAVDRHFSGCLGQPHTVLLCTFHKKRWVEITWEKIAAWGYMQCSGCRQRFTTPGQAVTFRPV